MAAKHLPDTQAIKDEFQQLRMQNVPQTKAREFLAEKYKRTPQAIRLLTQPSGLKESSAPEGDPLQTDFNAFGTSTLYDADGKVRLQWVKRKQQDEDRMAREMIAAMSEGLPKAEPTEPRSKTFRKDTLALYPFGDPHFGLYAWKEESGDDFDLSIAERHLCTAVARLVDTVPACEEALIVNCGDFFHADNMQGTTMRSNNALDTDTRWAKVLRVGVKAIRQCIESALQKHNHVTVINAIGNHDDHSAMFLSVVLSNVYENEPRVTINASPTILHFHEFGANMLVVHHGHTIKMDKLPLISAAEQPEMWGRTRHRFGVTGHIHHDSAKDFSGMRIESFRTLAARDAWHASMGYKAERDMKAILLHAEFGEIERHRVSVEMLESV
jgi:hypothetical protein